MMWMAVASSLLMIQQAPLTAQAVEEALDSLDWEPECGAVVEAAVRATGPPSKHVASVRRIRASALLPKLRVTVEKSLEHDRSLDDGGDGDIKLAIDTDDDLEIRGYVQWDLSALVFNPAEPGAAARRLQDARWRLDLAREVVAAWHERRKLVVLKILGAVEPDDLVAVVLRIEELTSLLDALTGGWFSEELEKRRETLPGGQTAIVQPQPVLWPPFAPPSVPAS